MSNIKFGFGSEVKIKEPKWAQNVIPMNDSLFPRPAVPFPWSRSPAKQPQVEPEQDAVDDDE